MDMNPLEITKCPICSTKLKGTIHPYGTTAKDLNTFDLKELIKGGVHYYKTGLIECPHKHFYVGMSELSIRVIIGEELIHIENTVIPEEYQERIKHITYEYQKENKVALVELLI